MRRPVLEGLTGALAFAPTVVLAHAGHADTSGLVQGLTHPFTGIDHLLAMIAVGVLAARLGGSARWLVPLAFIVVMVVGGTFGMAGVALAFAELGVAVSVVLLGMAVAFPFRLGTFAVAAVVGSFALFHGHVHGTEIPAAASALAYTAGFAGATALLHVIGLQLGTVSGLPQVNRRYRIVRAGGGTMALFGMAVLAGFL